MLKSDFPSQVPLLTSEIIPEVSMNKKITHKNKGITSSLRKREA